MAAVASPTPAPLTSAYGDHLYRRPSGRSFVRAARRPFLNRSSPQAAPARNVASITRPSEGDSSDDDDLAPIKLSAEAQAILEDNSQFEASGKEGESSDERGNNEELVYKNEGPIWIEGVRRTSVSPRESSGSPAPRVVRIASTARPAALTALARDGSFMYKTHEKTSEAINRPSQETRTPASHLRSVRVNGSRSHTRSPPSTLSGGRTINSGAESEGKVGMRQDTIMEDEGQKSNGEDGFPIGPSTIMRPRRGDENGVQSTMRMKRIGAGTFLNGPVRRGMIRRQSEEDDIPSGRVPDESANSPEMQMGRGGIEADLDDRPDDQRMHNSSPRERPSAAFRPMDTSIPASSLSLAAALSNRHYDLILRSTSPSQATYQTSKPTPASNGANLSSRSSGSKSKPVFKIASLPPLPSTLDQENDPPPTFKRSKPSAPVLGELQRGPDEKAPNIVAPLLRSPERQPLAPRSQNTPHRPAPAPPPKMSMLEAATSIAGSSRAKKTVHVIVNGKTYRRLDCVGRGGSSRVFRIMAENFKIFALKRVSLEDADMTAIAGYKGEIDLLRKLENVDRVIRLFDYEINEEKGILNVMMELGESDFNKMLNEQLKTENAKLDISFTRHYWKEMLECVQAVHEHSIVHSDLKPANFLLVKGQLKLIDFGIANAIQDNTVNVHRENQIGTPNYMSPESLVCHTPAVGAAGTKVLKLGKPSDVWSLGCILYQMTYGQPPFAHITKQFERIMSIPNPKVEIQFPTTGVGGAVVPFGLIKTLRRCLQREPSLRPTTQELLSESDPFLNPVAISADMLGRMISNVVSYCRRKEEALRANGELVGTSPIPSDADMKAWPWAFYEKLRQAQEDGTAW